MGKTVFEKWNDNEMGNFGSFHTALMEAYRLASGNNQRKLDVAFPEYFTLNRWESTIDYIMKELEIKDQYDTAKPQVWMDAMAAAGFDRKDLYLNYVWLYDEKAKIMGRPFNYKSAYADLLITKLYL